MLFLSLVGFAIAFPLNDASINVGSVQNPARDASLCNITDWSLVKNLFITEALYDQCRLEPKMLKNLDELFIQMETQDRTASRKKLFGNKPYDSSPLISKWFSLKQTYKLSKLQVVDEFNAGVLHHVILDARIKGDRLKVLKQVLDSRLVDIQLLDTLGNSPLHFCFLPDLSLIRISSFINTAKCVQLLILAGADPNQYNAPNGVAPIHMAATLPYPGPLDEIIKRGGNINLSVDNGISPLSQAILGGMFPVDSPMASISHLFNSRHLNLLIADKTDFDAVSGFVSWAGIRAFNLKAKRLTSYLLIRAGADLRQAVFGSNALGIAIERFDLPLVEFILGLPKSRIPLNQLDSNGRNIMHILATTDLDEFTQRLVDLGANVNIVDFSQETPLTIALGNTPQSPEMVESLLKAGANPNLATLTGKRPVNVLFERNSVDIFNHRYKLEQVALLLKYGADLSNIYKKSRPFTDLIVRLVDHLNDPNLNLPTWILETLLKTDLELETVEYHALIFVAFKYNKIQSVKSKLPTWILEQISEPFVGPLGLVATDKLKFSKFYQSISNDELFIEAKCFNMNQSPWMYELVRSVKVSKEQFYACKFQPSLETVTVTITNYCPDSSVKFQAFDKLVKSAFPNAQIKYLC